VEVVLGGGDLSVAEAFHHGPEVGAAGEEPGGVGVAEVVHADGEPEPGGFDGGFPDAVAEGVFGDGVVTALVDGGEQVVVAAECVLVDAAGEDGEQVVGDAENTGLVVLGVGLDEEPFAGGGVFAADFDDVSVTVMVRCAQSMCRGRRATSSPQRSPVSMSVSTSGSHRSGIHARRVWNSSGVRMRRGFVTTLGSRVSAAGLWGMTRSRTACLKMPCSRTWYFTTLSGARPASRAVVTQAWMCDGRMSPIGIGPK